MREKEFREWVDQTVKMKLDSDAVWQNKISNHYNDQQYQKYQTDNTYKLYQPIPPSDKIQWPTPSLWQSYLVPILTEGFDPKEDNFLNWLIKQKNIIADHIKDAAPSLFQAKGDKFYIEYEVVVSPMWTTTASSRILISLTKLLKKELSLKSLRLDREHKLVLSFEKTEKELEG